MLLMVNTVEEMVTIDLIELVRESYKVVKATIYHPRLVLTFLYVVTWYVPSPYFNQTSAYQL